MVCRPTVDQRLGARRGVGDAHLRQARLDRLGHAAMLFAFDDVRPGLARQFGGQGFDVIAAAPGIDDAVGVGLLLQEQLGVARDAGGELGRQPERLVERIGVQALRLTLRGGHRFDAGAGDVVVDILRRQAPAAGLAVRA